MVKEIFSYRFFQFETEYDAYLKTFNIPSSGNRAVCFDTAIGPVIAIDVDYYRSGGILEEQIEAIRIHEKVERTSVVDDPHLEATIAEYEYIFNTYGLQGLRTYHSNIYNLIGGDSSIRIKSFQTIVEKL